MGIQQEDVIISVNGVAYNLENVQPLIAESFQWTADTELTMVVERDGEEIEVLGLMGNPSKSKLLLGEIVDATEQQIELRNYWLKK